jgi:hypothetical protein
MNLMIIFTTANANVERIINPIVFQFIVLFLLNFNTNLA